MKTEKLWCAFAAVVTAVSTISAENADKLIELRREIVDGALIGKWRTSFDTYELGYSKESGTTFTSGGHNHVIPHGPLIATEAIISTEKNALLIVLRAKNEKNELQFRAFISIGDGGSVVVVPYLDNLYHDWEPIFDSIIEFEESSRTIRLKEEAKSEDSEPKITIVKLEEIKTRRRPDGERMRRRWEKLLRER